MATEGVAGACSANSVFAIVFAGVGCELVGQVFLERLKNVHDGMCSLAGHVWETGKEGILPGFLVGVVVRLHVEHAEILSCHGLQTPVWVLSGVFLRRSRLFYTRLNRCGFG